MKLRWAATPRPAAEDTEPSGIVLEPATACVRIHMWYEAKFGYQITPYTSTAEAITTFPTTATAIGLKPIGGSLLLNAPLERTI